MVNHGRWLENLPDCWVVGEKWEVTITMAVELDGPVVARVNGTFMAYYGESCWRIYQSEGW